MDTANAANSGHGEQWTQRTVETANSGHSAQWTQYPVDTAHSELYFAVFNNRVSIAQTVLFDTTSVVKITVPSVFTI